MSKILLLIQGNDDLHVHFICAKSLHLCPSLQMDTNLFQIWTVASQAPLSMGFSRQEYWSGLPFPSPGGLLNPGIEPVSSALAGRFLQQVLPTEPPGKPLYI